MQKIFKTLIAFSLLLHPLISFSQDYRISNFGAGEGISHPFVYTINQDTKGYIWIGTGEGLCQFNGFVFNTKITQDSLANQVAGISFKDSKGNLWFGYYSGDLARYNGRQFETIRPGVEINSAITGMGELAGGSLLIATLNDGLFAVDPLTGKGSAIEMPEHIMCTVMLLKGTTVLLGSPEGIAICQVDPVAKNIKINSRVTELEFTKVQDIQPSYTENCYWIATEDQGLYRLNLTGNQYKLNKTVAGVKISEENIQSVFEDASNNLWLGTLRSGVIKLEQPDGNGNFKMAVVYNKSNGLPGNSIKKIFRDLEGNIWFATYGDGLSLLAVQPMNITDADVSGLDNDILSVAVTEDKTCYLGGAGGLFKLKAHSGAPAIRVKSVPAVKITTVYLDGGNLYIGTEANGLYVLETAKDIAKKVSYEAYSMGNWVTSIAVNKSRVYIGTKDGIYQFNKSLQEEAHYTTTNGMPHNNIEHILIDNKGRLLFATRTNGIYQLSEKGQISNLYSTGSAEVEFKSIAEDDQGNIWAASYGDGVICFRDDSVYQYTLSSGLRANFCYSIVKGARNSIWVGHRLGISRINTDNLRISVYDQNMGIKGDCNTNAVFSDKSGVVYIGTTGGLISYDLSKNKSIQPPPFTNIVSVLISDKEYDFSKEIVLPYKAYKLKIEFIGLSYSDPQAVRYQYKLDGYDPEWSEVTSQTAANYSRVEDGEYTFYLKSYNSEGISQEVPISIKIRIKPPVWKTWWFITLTLITIAISFFFIIKIRERKQKKLQEYLERELVARTKEVVEQKEEIEIKNRDITDSINYAKRIQTSMLPPIKRLQHHFSGSFVFYSPRDIVSGDFYWFDQVNDNKFTIVCADSTGHGVPGAFMSMIGSTLIKDICNRATGNSPSKVLQVLDCELRNTLNQNLDDGTKPGDGMDIIVCEIDLKTHYVRYASAMRPMIIYRNGEEIFIKGSRNSVGGHYDMGENLFEDEGLQLSKGDIIYMFSDGYSDQFGGPMGKKFKMVRLKNLLQDIHTKPMDEQCLHVKNTFNLWKENYEQVDDVLFMGIKI